MWCCFGMFLHHHFMVWSLSMHLIISNDTLCLSVLFFFSLWRNSRKKVKPNREDRTYMSLKKTDVSTEYDVIGQAIHPDSNWSVKTYFKCVIYIYIFFFVIWTFVLHYAVFLVFSLYLKCIVLYLEFYFADFSTNLEMWNNQFRVKWIDSVHDCVLCRTKKNTSAGWYMGLFLTIKAILMNRFVVVSSLDLPQFTKNKT